MEPQYARITLARPLIYVSDVKRNLQEHKKLIEEAEGEGAHFIVFPELSLTGYTCNELFHQSYLQKQSREAILELVEYSSQFPDLIIIFGSPLVEIHELFNCSFVVSNGKILGIVPKTYLPNYDEFKEQIYFSNAPNHTREIYFPELNCSIQFGSLIFQTGNFTFGVEICEDLWSPIPPSNYLALSGASIIFNLSASNDIVGKRDHRRRLINEHSRKTLSIYCFVSAGIGESTSDIIFSGHSLIYENGVMLNEALPFSNVSLLTEDVDFELINSLRIRNTTWNQSITRHKLNIPKVQVYFPLRNLNKTIRKVNPYPYFPFHPEIKSVFDYFKSKDQNLLYDISQTCSEIFELQSQGLAQRIVRAHAEKLVVAVSGGLDSTHTLLVACRSLQIIGKSKRDIYVLLMPSFGTSEVTFSQSKELCESLDVPYEIINLEEIVQNELNLLHHDGTIDLTYENTQARMRYQLAFNKANQIKGLLVGTGDLSEIALGWMTYAGDQISSYAVNSSVPKTMLQVIINWYELNKAPKKLKPILGKILKTPISPELRPPHKNGEISQITEATLGPYEVHDFFLYHFVKNWYSPSKILFLAKIAFEDKYSDKILKDWLRLFLDRFFKNQFKRTAMPDGPKVTDITLSPRTDWRLPSDISPEFWLNDLED